MTGERAAPLTPSPVLVSCYVDSPREEEDPHCPGHGSQALGRLAAVGWSSTGWFKSVLGGETRAHVASGVQELCSRGSDGIPRNAEAVKRCVSAMGEV